MRFARSPVWFAALAISFASAQSPAPVPNAAGPASESPVSAHPVPVDTVSVDSVSERNSDCFACHDDASMTMTLEDGTELPIAVSPATFATSVHARELVCLDCHEGKDGDHPSGATFASRRAFVRASYEACKKCHFETYTRTLESVHFDLVQKGDPNAPVCTDCHGAHDTPNPRSKQAMLSRSCAGCHQPIYEKYALSVHGKALVGEGNQDVPACADCHTSHTVADPKSASFHLSSPETCIRCHGDAALMAKYDLSADVATTFLRDFHGATAALGAGRSVQERQLTVTCVDCHGHHEMVSPKERGPDAMKATVAASCKRCHTEASPDFPAAWLSHYRPSLQHAPLVFLVDLLYKVMIPFIALGLALQVALHLYRAVVGR